MALVEGVAYWASVQAPNTTYDPEYCVDLVISDEDAATLKGKGLRLKEIDGKPAIKFKRGVARKDGTDNPKPTLRDAENNPFHELVGNGSKVIVQYRIYDWEWKGRAGVSADFCGMQVLEHVPYKTVEGESEYVEDGAEFEEVGKTKVLKPIVDVTEAPFDDE